MKLPPGAEDAELDFEARENLGMVVNRLFQVRRHRRRDPCHLISRSTMIPCRCVVAGDAIAALRSGLVSRCGERMVVPDTDA